MKSKKILIRLISLLIILCVLPLASCSKKEKRVVTTLSAGSSVWVVGNANKVYEIKELGEKTETGVFSLEGYYVSDSGTLYEISDNRGKVVSTIKLVKKSETYNPQVYEFNLDEYAGHGIVITEEMDYVKIFSSDPSVVHDLAIIIDFERTKPCDIEFENVNIQTSETCSVLYNYSQYDLNVKFEGENYFKAGKSTSNEEYYYIISQADKHGGAVLDLELTALAYAGKYFEVRVAGAYFYTVRDFLKGKGLSTQHLVEAIDEMIFVLDAGINGLETLIRNQDGADGVDGAHAFVSLGSVYFYGEGSVTLVGGDGLNGHKASKGIGGNNAKGGDGGDAGAAIVANVFVENIGGTFRVHTGSPGIGGEGAGYSPIQGEKGTTPEEVLSSFSCTGLN